MKHILITLCLLFMTLSWAFAQDMVIHLKNGKTVKYGLSQIEEITYSSMEPSGLWIGSCTYNDPSIGHPVEYWLKIDFDDNVATSSGCSNVGKVKVLNESTVQIDWPGCGLENVTYSISGDALVATGNERAYSDSRLQPSRWRLRRQN